MVQARLGKGRDKERSSIFSTAPKAGRLLRGHRGPGEDSVPNPDSTNRACGEASGQEETPGNKFPTSKGSSYKSEFQKANQAPR